jgi:hypothetical protein
MNRRARLHASREHMMLQGFIAFPFLIASRGTFYSG